MVQGKRGTWEAIPPGFASHVIGNSNYLLTQPWWRIRSQPVIENPLFCNYLMAIVTLSIGRKVFIIKIWHIDCFLLSFLSFFFDGLPHLVKWIPIIFTELLPGKDFFYFSFFIKYFDFVKHFMLQTWKPFRTLKLAHSVMFLYNVEYSGFNWPIENYFVNFYYKLNPLKGISSCTTRLISQAL